MFFQFNSTTRQLGRTLAKTQLIIGLSLIAFAMIVWLLKDIFAFIAMGILLLIGLGCCINAIKIFFSTIRFMHDPNAPNADHRKNVRIHQSDSDNDDII